jgi:hypothetical protein
MAKQSPLTRRDETLVSLAPEAPMAGLKGSCSHDQYQRHTGVGEILDGHVSATLTFENVGPKISKIIDRWWIPQRKLKSELEGRGNDDVNRAKYGAESIWDLTALWMTTNARGPDAFILAIQLT